MGGHENTKQQMVHVNGNLKKTTLHVKQVHELLESTAKELKDTKARLGQTTGTLDQTRRVLQEEKDKVKTLKNGQDIANASQNKLAAHLEETNMLANETSKALKDTNALVLPNLYLDQTCPSGMGGNSGRRANTAREARSGSKKVSVDRCKGA